MNKLFILLISTVFIMIIINGCGKKKESPMVDMDTIKTDGSYDDKYFFRKEIEKEEYRSKKYKKNNF